MEHSDLLVTVADGAGLQSGSMYAAPVLQGGSAFRV